MSYFDQIYSRLFRRKKSSLVYIQEVIKRSTSFAERFNAWKTSDTCSDILNDIWQSYFWKQRGIDKDPNVSILNSTYSNGFAISYTPEIEQNNFQYLFDYLADRVKGLGYLLVVSRVTMKDHGDEVETTEMHYLKPKPTFIEPIDQRYGNVQIEFKKYNDEPSRIKVLANTYPNRKYKSPENFEDLARHILNA